MSGGQYPYEAMRNDFGDLGLPEWAELPTRLQDLWTSGPTQGPGGVVLYPGTETLEWAKAVEFAGGGR